MKITDISLETKIFDELAQEFRYWNAKWEKYDKKETKSKPIGIEEFIEILKSKYKIEKK